MSAADLTQEVAEFHWLLKDFVKETAGAREAFAVSSDGLLLAASLGPDREGLDQIAAVISGLASMSRGASHVLGLAELRTVIIESEGGYLLVARIGNGSSLGVVPERAADIGLVGYHMTALATRAGECLSPALLAELAHVLR